MTWTCKYSDINIDIYLNLKRKSTELKFLSFEQHLTASQVWFHISYCVNSNDLHTDLHHTNRTLSHFLPSIHNVMFHIVCCFNPLTYSFPLLFPPIAALMLGTSSPTLSGSINYILCQLVLALNWCFMMFTLSEILNFGFMAASFHQMEILYMSCASF